MSLRTECGRKSDQRWSARLAFTLITMVVAGAFAGGLGNVGVRASAACPAEMLRPTIEPMSLVADDGSGYFSDPYPVPLAGKKDSREWIVTGTTKAMMRCIAELTPRCFSWGRLKIGAGSLRPVITAAGATITNYQNLNAYRDEAGAWHAVLAVGVNNAAHPDYWTVLVHARPAGVIKSGALPLAWSADTILSGSFSTPEDGNYDGKYVRDHGRLYLLYVKNFVAKPALRNGAVLQPMRSPTEPGMTPAVTLLRPDEAFESERYGRSRAKLVEAPYIATVGGKYALIYSTGAYREAGYKVGVAWSDTLLPAKGGSYRKVAVAPNLAGVGAGRHDIHYLLQSQDPCSGNFTGDRVISPGVASLVRDDRGWAMLFAGFDPGDRPLLLPDVARADHRRPYFVRMVEHVDRARKVADASADDLAEWLQPA